MKNQLIIPALIVGSALLASAWITQTPYRYSKTGSVNIRVHRITGEAEALVLGRGWMPADQLDENGDPSAQLANPGEAQ